MEHPQAADQRVASTEDPTDRHRPAMVLDKKFFINKINYLNFQDRTAIACFEHLRYPKEIFFSLRPQPCTDSSLTCQWQGIDNILEKIRSYRFKEIIIPDGTNTYYATPDILDLNNDFVRFAVPAHCFQHSSRKFQRHKSNLIDVKLIQNGVIFHGELMDFSSIALHIMIDKSGNEPLHWINAQVPVTIVLKKGYEIIFSGDCQIVKHSQDLNERSFILAPVRNNIQRYKPKTFRSKRQHLSPSPTFSFTHPLTNEAVFLQIQDISGSGFSVHEEMANACLLPGMIIPLAEISFVTNVVLKCKAQVIYLDSPTTNDNLLARSGLAILDMSMDDQISLLSMLQQANDNNSFVCNRVNLDKLWLFFFETGFVYPQKYHFIQENKDTLKETYRKIYTSTPSISRHFIYQKNGNILAHMAMIRFYKNSWMIHHHASQKRAAKKGGIIVLQQISRYVNEVHHLFSAHLNFVFCYFRPENRFPNKVFGGVCDFINDKNGCSIDKFAYFHFKNDSINQIPNTESLEFSRASNYDLEELKLFIGHYSKGLIVHALDLEINNNGDIELSEEYQKIGLKRERHIFSLRKNGRVICVIVVTVADFGLNMSDLTNCFKVFVLEADHLSPSILKFILSTLCIKYGRGEMPVLLYPSHIAQQLNIDIEKFYNLWILNLQYLDKYFEFCNMLIGEM